MERSQNIRTHMHLQMLRNRKITKHFLQEKRKNAAHIFGAHERTVNGVKGSAFLMYGHPKALSVSVVGEFNKYDGRVHLMERIEGYRSI